MEGEMKTVENGKDLLIHIVSIFVPSVQAGVVAGTRKADEKVRGWWKGNTRCLWAVTLQDREPQSITPHSSAQSCSALLCSAPSLLMKKSQTKTLHLLPFYLWVCLQSHTSNQSNLDSAESKCHCCQTKAMWIFSTIKMIDSFFTLSIILLYCDEIINHQLKKWNENQY